MKKLFLIVLVSFSGSVWAEGARQALTTAATSQKKGVTPGSENWPWYPMCLFVEAGAGSQKAIGEAIKKNAGTQCQVNIELFPFFVNNLPRDGAGIQKAAAAKCNAIDGLKKLGATRASVAVITKEPGKWKSLGCSNKDLKGCGQYSQEPDPSIVSKMEARGQYGGVAQRNKTTVAIIDGGGTAVSETEKWALGIGMMGLGTGTSYGNGVGKDDEGGTEAARIDSDKWNPEVCRRMQQSAFPNPGKFRFTEDYQLSDLMRKPMDLQDGKPLFRDSANATASSPSPSQHPGGGGGGGGMGSGGGAASASGSSAGEGTSRTGAGGRTGSVYGAGVEPTADPSLTADPNFVGQGHPQANEKSTGGISAKPIGPPGSKIGRQDKRVGMDENAKSGNSSKGSSLSGIGSATQPATNAGGGGAAGNSGATTGGGFAGGTINPVQPPKNSLDDGFFKEKKEEPAAAGRRDSGRKPATKSAY